jgi:hypothetical protein
MFGLQRLLRPDSALAPCLLLPLLAGCVTVYQPLRSLQRPVAIDTGMSNFEGQRVLVRCASNDYLDKADALRLCSSVSAVLGNQGAVVELETAGSGPAGVHGAPDSGSAAQPVAGPQLIVELKARLVHSDNSPLLWVLSLGTATLLPAVTEHTFSQDVLVRGADGFVLASDNIQARFVRYFGLGAWAANSLLDLLVRSESEKLTGSAANQEFSRDYYGHLSQLLLHAKLRAQMLRDLDAPPPSRQPQAAAAARP